MAAKKKKDLFPGPKEGIEEPQIRVYYRHVMTGDRAYAVVEDGQTRLKLDRAGEPFTRRLDGNWEQETEHRPLLRYQLWKVAFESDKALCAALGLIPLSKRDWLNLTDEKRIEWGKEGPKTNPLRQRLFAAVMAALEEHSE